MIKDFLSEMIQRGLIAQNTHPDELAEHLTEQRCAYVGFDPTAESLHVGHLLPIMTLARWQKSGHKAIAVMGGATAMIGDPTGKTSMRQMLELDQINSNIENFKRLVKPLLQLDGEKGLALNNWDWLGGMNYIEFLREIGTQFSVNRMLTAECFKARMESGLSFIEFNYMLLQSYDFLYLNRNYNCTVQLGGDDQWSNIISGVDLIRRLERKQAFGLTNPLLVTKAGKKMGKTEKGAVWLDANLTSPYDYFQFWRNLDDAMIGSCLSYFTFLPVEEIKELVSVEGSAINATKEKLAYETTALVHGEEEAKKALEGAKSLFASGGDVSARPETTWTAAQFGEDRLVAEICCEIGLCESNSEARRLIKQNGLSVNGEKVTDIQRKLILDQRAFDEGFLFKKGKKYYHHLRILP